MTWTATIYYRTKEGEPLDVVHDRKTLDQIVSAISLGPPPETIEHIFLSPDGEEKQDVVDALWPDFSAKK